jgi:ABC-2 type transport system permease protein
VIRGIRTIVAKDLRQRLRDKSFFLLGILTPFVLALVLNLVFGGGSDGEIEVRMGVVDADGSEVSAQLAGHMAEADGTGGITVESLPAGTDPETAIDEQGLDAVVVLPQGFGEAVTSAGAPEVELVENPDRAIQAGIAGSVVDGFTAEIDRTRLLNAAGARLGVRPEAAGGGNDLQIVQEAPNGERLGTSARLMAGMAIMFVFFTVMFGVTTLLEERRDGTLARLLAAPVPRDAILASKGIVSYLLGVTATMILLVAATFLVGADWGSWLGVVVLVLAACLTAVALMAIVAGIAKTAESAGAVQSIIAVGLALLGGSWFPVSGEGLLGNLAKITPHYWFLEGLEQLAGAASWTVVAPSVLALVVIAVAAGVPAAVLLRRRLVP